VKVATLRLCLRERRFDSWKKQVEANCHSAIQKVEQDSKTIWIAGTPGKTNMPIRWPSAMKERLSEECGGGEEDLAPKQYGTAHVGSW
jgi:hypothetical protein